MPIIRPNIRKQSETDSASNALTTRGATGSHLLLGRAESRPSSDSLFRSRSRQRNYLQAIDEFRLKLGTPDLLQIDLEDSRIRLVIQMKGLTSAPNDWLRHILVDAGTGTPVSPTQGEALELSPLFRSQVELIVNDDISPKLRDRLSVFEANRVGLDPVSSSTKSEVNELMSWLCSQSDAVSATVSNDGMLSIAAGFDNDVRLYVEIERNGSTEAAVTRKRRYARDVRGNSVADLTPEVLLDAIGSV